MTNNAEIVWTFATKNFDVRLRVERDWNYVYDGDDEDGSYQAQIDTGEIIAFDSCVEVVYRGEVIGADYLGGSTYFEHTASEFWSEHRSANPMNRNCTLYRAVHGENCVVLCHYFPDMVRTAVRAARAYLASVPKMRNVA